MKTLLCLLALALSGSAAGAQYEYALLIIGPSSAPGYTWSEINNAPISATDPAQITARLSCTDQLRARGQLGLLDCVGMYGWSLTGIMSSATGGQTLVFQRAR